MTKQNNHKLRQSQDKHTICFVLRFFKFLQTLNISKDKCHTALARQDKMKTKTNDEDTDKEQRQRTNTKRTTTKPGE
jgi:hypothetical protein